MGGGSCKSSRVEAPAKQPPPVDWAGHTVVMSSQIHHGSSWSAFLIAEPPRYLTHLHLEITVFGAIELMIDGLPQYQLHHHSNLSHKNISNIDHL